MNNKMNSMVETLVQNIRNKSSEEIDLIVSCIDGNMFFYNIIVHDILLSNTDMEFTFNNDFSIQIEINKITDIVKEQEMYTIYTKNDLTIKFFLETKD